MRWDGIAAESGRFVLAVGVLIGSVACTAKTGSAPPAPIQPAPTASASAAPSTHVDAGPMLPEIMPPTIIHPGDGGIRVGDLNAAKKIDILFMVDDSISMTDKHEVLKAAIPDLLNRFVNPICLDRFGATSQPATADTACPGDMNRQFSPVRDIHIGIVTSSLGTLDDVNAVCPGKLSPSGDDNAHLVGSLDRAASVPTYPGGFLVWDPDQKAMPPGQKDITALIGSFRSLVDAIGEKGCGYENQLEAWYRFLVDPEPRLGTRSAPCNGMDGGVQCPAPYGIDQTILDQRAAFLRPDSLLVIVMLTDENDCSMTDDGNFILARGNLDAPQGAAACATNAADPCCYPCFLPAPAGCPNPDPVCSQSKTLVNDSANLRCFDGKRRFGFDGLQPVQRYIDALTKTAVPSRSGALVQNPIFAGGRRTASQVFLVGIVGVPWQDVATDAALASQTDLRLKSARELRDGNVWSVVLGDPSTRTPPKDALMTEAIQARMGTNPVTGVALAPSNAGYLANPINGHERIILAEDDLQYACIFRLPAARDCGAVPSGQSCDCDSPANGEKNPLCQLPDGTYGTTQSFAKALPAPRILQVLKGVGDAGVLASICPKNIVDPTSEGYGYRPVIGTLVQDVAPMLIK